MKKKISSSLIISIIYHFCRNLAQIIKKLKIWLLCHFLFNFCSVFILYMNIKILVQYFLCIPHVQARFTFIPLIVGNN